MTRDYVSFTDAFERCEIDADDFAHADHVGVAYEMLRRYDFLEASTKYARCIDKIATDAGATTKFSVTITLAFLSVIAERLHTTEHASYDGFIERNQDLLESSVLKRWYSSERLGSDLARTLFLMPEPSVA